MGIPVLGKYLKKSNFKYLLFIFLVTNLLIIFPLQKIYGLEGFEQVAENKYLGLYIKETTTEIAVIDKASGDIWYSNPPQREEKEKIARGTTRDRLNSQFSISYLTPEGRSRDMDTYNDSIIFDQYQIIPLDGGVRVEYTLGQKWDESSYFPVMISKQRMEEEILPDVDENEKDAILDSYILISLEQIEEGQELVSPPFLDDKREIFAEYTLTRIDDQLRGQSKINLIEDLFDYIRWNRSDLSGLGDIRHQDLTHLIENPTYLRDPNLLPWDEESVVEILKEIGYTPDNVAVVHLENNLDPPTPAVRIFDVPIEYRLEGDSLLAKIPGDQIRYPDQVETEHLGQTLTVSIPLYSINLLQFFGAADRDESGYIFVPDGPGGLINLNSERLYATPYQDVLYGTDLSRREIEEMGVRQNLENVRFPVYGLKKENSAFLGIIEKGDAFSEIRADIAGRTYSYNFVNSRFNIRPYQELTFAGGVRDENIYVHQPRLYDGDIKVRFMFLSDEKADYVGMSHRYQNYLVEKMGLEKLSEQEQELPFYLELVGTVYTLRPLMGIPRQRPLTLTTYQQAVVLMEKMQKEGINNIQLKLTGWLDGGLLHGFPARISRETALGDLNQMKSFLDFLRQHDINFYPEVSFLNVFSNSFFDGFSAQRHASRYLDRTYVHNYQYDLATFQQKADQVQYVLSPGSLEEVVSNFVENTLKKYFNDSGLSMRYIGNQLHSDFRRDLDLLIDRQQAQDKIVEQLNWLKENQGFSLMVDGGDFYSLPYIDHILNFPLQSNNFNLIDKTIPFFPIVLSGYMQYAGEAFNLAGDFDRNLLRSIEMGARPYFSWFYGDSDLVKQTEFAYLYSSGYESWFNEAVDLYHRVNNTLGKVQGQIIIDHQQLKENVFVTTYEEGKKIIVNYNNFDINIGDETIPARDFSLFKEGDLK